jgi:outer membrane receptor protein involved in Fe transport
MALSAALAAPALAQQAGSLEEIVVTAEHREVSLQDTQISMSAFSADAIQ